MSFDNVVVLDAWPVVEYYVGNDPSAVEVERLLSGDSAVVVMSSVNYAEVYGAIATIARDFSAADGFMDSLKGVVSVVEPSPEVSVLAALVKHCYHMSLGDCFAAATAISLSPEFWPGYELSVTGGESDSCAELWTGDSELICENRVWRIRDLRTGDHRKRHAAAEARGKKKTGIRAGTSKSWSMLNHPSGPVPAARASAVAKQTARRK